MAAQNVYVPLVEDDEIEIQTVKCAFEKNKINNPLQVARDGVEALDILRGNNGTKKLDPRPLIILLNTNMPKINGLEFLQELRKDDQSVKVRTLVDRI